MDNNTIKRNSTPFRKGKEIPKDNPHDKVYTPDSIAKLIIDTIDTKFGLSGLILDPCKGPGAFYNNYPSKCQKDYCEIDEGKDFFKYDKKVDFIISNPPYSIFEEFFKHSIEICDNIVYLVPVNKLTSSGRRVADIAKWGGIPYIQFFKGSEVNFPFGFSVAAIYFKKGYKGNIEVDYSPAFKQTYGII